MDVVVIKPIPQSLIAPGAAQLLDYFLFFCICILCAAFEMLTCPVQTRRVLLQQAAALQLERVCSLTLGQPVNYVSAAVDITDGNVATPNQNLKPRTIPQTSKPSDACSVTRLQGAWWTANVSVPRSQVGVVAVGSKVTPLARAAFLCRRHSWPMMLSLRALCDQARCIVQLMSYGT
jgi:hypothetical protein